MEIFQLIKEALDEFGRFFIVILSRKYMSSFCKTSMIMLGFFNRELAL